MTLIAERAVLFADLRGSTSLYETLGNAEATSVVTHTIGQIAGVVPHCRGSLVKTLGDGLLAVFPSAQDGLDAADRMHAALQRLVSRGAERGASSGLLGLRLQVAIALGEIVEMGGDCFGDAVNVAARLLDHAGDNETLITSEALTGLERESRARFRSLHRLRLRGRAEAVQVYVLDSSRGGDTAATTFGHFAPAAEPDGIRLAWLESQRVFSRTNLPVVLGRSPEATYCIDDSRVSRLHVRVDWHGGAFQLMDMSSNGTFVRFADDTAIVTLRRSTCTLHGSGIICLGSPPGDPTSPVVRFEVLRFAETKPQEPFDFAP